MKESHKCYLRVRILGIDNRQGYLPNITENVVSRCGSPPSLNVVTNSQLFPAVPSNYGPRWTSQLPDAYLHSPNSEFQNKNIS